MKQNLYIIEGTRGAGKTTITNWLREKIPYSQLIRLSGTSDKTIKGKEKVFKARQNDFIFAENLVGCDLHLIMDRCFVSESVYADVLGYKEYNFKEETQILTNRLNELKYDNIYLVNMYVGDTKVLEERLKRDKADFLDLKFSIEESIKQQNAYRTLIDSLDIPNVKVIHYDASKDLESNKEELKNILRLDF